VVQWGAVEHGAWCLVHVLKQIAFGNMNAMLVRYQCFLPHRLSGLKHASLELLDFPKTNATSSEPRHTPVPHLQDFIVFLC
jgi:hypothetical protein